MLGTKKADRSSYRFLYFHGCLRVFAAAGCTLARGGRATAARLCCLYHWRCSWLPFDKTYPRHGKMVIERSGICENTA